MQLLTSPLAYFRGALTELSKVRWPTHNQAIRLSVIVIGFTFAAAFVYGIVDYLLGQGMTLLLSFV